MNTQAAPAQLALSTATPIRKLLGLGDFIQASDEERKKSTLIFSLLGFVILMIFVALNLSVADPRVNLQGKFQLAEALFLVLPAVLASYWHKGSARFAENLMVLTGCIVFLTLSVFGGVTGDANYWSFVLPYLVFFLRGQGAGWLVGALYAVACPLIMAYSSRYLELWKYTDKQCIYYGLSYFFNVITAAYFNLLRHNFQARLQYLVDFNTKEALKHLETLKYNAVHDVPTRLLNRQGIVDAIQQSSSTSQLVPDSVLSVVSVRFTRVVEIANIVGIDNVNLALIQLTDQLRASLPHQVHIGRTRLDELVLVFQLPSEKGHIFELLEGIEKLQELHKLGGFSIQDEVHIGAAVRKLGTSEGDPGDLLRKSEQALLFAIDKNRRCQFFDDALDQHFIERNTLYEKVRAAVLGKSIFLYYQPQIDLRTNRVIGAEALARWIDPQEGFISPDVFIPIIESTGLLKKFSIWTAQQALADCRHWQEILPGVTVSLNLSANALLDPDVIDALERSLAQTGITPALINVELTESVMLESPDKAMESMHRVVALGMGLSIDDYGAGCSSLTYVKEFPAKEIKIDKSFVLSLGTSSKDMAIVESTINLVHAFGQKVLAEGIEDAATLAQLTRLACDYGQGWYYAKAMPRDDFMAWSTKHHAESNQPH